jgi:RimJ/RimL family protein N-acetyltransferase
MFRRDCWEDLLLYAPGSEQPQGREAFLQEARARLESRQHVYTLVEGCVLVHYGWLQERVSFARDDWVGLGCDVRPESSCLWDYYTHPNARGRGLYRLALCHTLHEAFELAHAQQAYISVYGENAVSRHVIEKVGFEYLGSLIRRKRIFFNQRYGIPNSADFRALPLPKR